MLGTYKLQRSKPSARIINAKSTSLASRDFKSRHVQKRLKDRSNKTLSEVIHKDLKKKLSKIGE